MIFVHYLTSFLTVFSVESLSRQLQFLVKITDVEDIFEPVDMTDEERELRRIAISEKNKNRFSKKNVEQYVGTLLSDRNMILASDIPIETKRDLIRVIFISLYGHSTKSEYSVKQKEEIISLQGFRFRDFEIRRGINNGNSKCV